MKSKTEIQIFTSDIFGEIRTCQVNNQIMFVSKDVTQALGYKNPSNALQVHVDPEDKTTYPIQVSGSNYKTNTLFVNESGLYALDKAYSIAFPKSTPINVNKKKRMFEG